MRLCCIVETGFEGKGVATVLASCVVDEIKEGVAVAVGDLDHVGGCVGFECC